MDKKTDAPYKKTLESGGKELNKHRKQGKSRDEISIETLRALRDGEEWAYNEVYLRFASPLKDFLTILIQNEEDAKELNHDLFVSLWTGREKIIPEKGIKGFLFMRAKNLAMNYFDHKKVKEKYIDFQVRNLNYSFAYNQDSIFNEVDILIEIALKGMSEQRRTIFKMRYGQDKTIDEIAEELHLSPATIRNNLTMIVKTIRDIIAIYIIFWQFP